MIAVDDAITLLPRRHGGHRRRRAASRQPAVDVEDYLPRHAGGTGLLAGRGGAGADRRSPHLRPAGRCSPGGELCDDARCQVYVGPRRESAGQDAAVARTTANGAHLRRRSPPPCTPPTPVVCPPRHVEGFGTPDGVYPYLTTVRYDTDNPLPWHLEVALERRRLHDWATGARSPRSGSAPPDRAGGRLDMVIEGTAGDVTVDGRQFARSPRAALDSVPAERGGVRRRVTALPEAGEGIQALAR